MTKRDYELIARVLSRFSGMTTTVEVGAATAVIAEAMAASIAIYNPRFNRDRFLAACDIPARYFANPEQEAA